MLDYLIAQKNLAYDEADKLTREFNRLKDLGCPQEHITIRSYNWRTETWHTEDHYDVQWETIYRRMNTLRGQGHTHLGTSSQGSQRKTWEIYQDMVDAYDKAAEWEAQIQAHRRSQEHPAAA